MKEIEKLKVLLVGETIIDQYIFGDVLGKSGKEPHLVLNEKKSETYLGGAAAIANHLITFCNTVDFLTLMGKEKFHTSFVKKLLRKKLLHIILKNQKRQLLLKKDI